MHARDAFNCKIPRSATELVRVDTFLSVRRTDTGIVSTETAYKEDINLASTTKQCHYWLFLKPEEIYNQ